MHPRYPLSRCHADALQGIWISPSPFIIDIFVSYPFPVIDLTPTAEGHILPVVEKKFFNAFIWKHRSVK